MHRFIRRPTLRTLGRKRLPKHWKENGWPTGDRTAPPAFRRRRTRVIRHIENLHLANCIANDKLETYEPIGLTRRDALHLYL